MTGNFLIADDSSIIRKVARRILEGHGFTVSEAADGRQAFEQVGRHMPDGILLDWSLPVMDSFEFLRTLRALPGGDHPKVVFCAVENELAVIARAMHAGADETLLKPFDRDVLSAKLYQVGLI